MAVPDQAPSRQSNDHCFVCGKQNAQGLRLRFTADGDHAVSAPWRTDKVWEGYPGVIHGGIISTVLDEAMSKAVAASGLFAFTCELRVRLRARVQAAEDLQIRGWVVERRKRKIVAEGTVIDVNGTERAHGWATFLEKATQARYSFSRALQIKGHSEPSATFPESGGDR